MDKAEETIKIIRSNKPYDVKLKALNEYAAEVSRESNKKTALEFAFEILGYNDYPNLNQDEKIKSIIRKKFNKWLKEQEKL